MVWDDVLLTGVGDVDEQHKEIFRRLELLKNQRDPARIPSLIRYFEQYLFTHANDEQKLFETAAYSQAGIHTSHHSYCIRQFILLREELMAGGNASLVVAYREVDNFMDEWFLQHVRQYDMEFAYFYKYGADEAGVTNAANGVNNQKEIIQV